MPLKAEYNMLETGVLELSKIHSDRSCSLRVKEGLSFVLTVVQIGDIDLLGDRWVDSVDRDTETHERAQRREVSSECNLVDILATPVLEAGEVSPCNLVQVLDTRSVVVVSPFTPVDEKSQLVSLGLDRVW